MGVISTIAGLGTLIREAGGVAKVLKGDKASEDAAQHEEFIAALAQLGKEFETGRASWFDIIIDGINRLPRPALAMGTIGLFVYAMVDPVSFAARMQGLNVVPEPLWWLLGAVVSFYFGARELHYLRNGRRGVDISDVVAVADRQDTLAKLARDREPADVPEPEAAEENPALAEWRRIVALRREG